MKKVFFVLSILAMVFICSCEAKFIEISEQTMESYFADKATLNQLTQEGYVDYRIARYFACAELSQTAADFGWNNVTLSEYPIIIYNSITENPKYYEFRVNNGTKEIGAVSCNAVKNEGNPVKYILPFAKEVIVSNARSALKKNGKFIDSGYPTKLAVKNNKSARAVDSETGLEVDEIQTDIPVREFIQNANEDLLKELGLSTSEELEKYYQKLEEEEKKVENLWDAIENNAELILAENPDALLEETFANNRAVMYNCQEKKLEKWDRIKEWHNFGGYCGPNCVSFILLGLGEESGVNDIPLRNNYNELSDFYDKVQNGIGTGPKLFSNLRSYMENNSDYTLKTDFGHFWNTIKQNLDNKELPCISLRSSKSLLDLAWHYRVIYGTKINNMKEDKSFLWWSWTKWYDDCYYVMHDNGTDNNENKGYFYESKNTGNHIGSAHVEKK